MINLKTKCVFYVSEIFKFCFEIINSEWCVILLQGKYEGAFKIQKKAPYLESRCEVWDRLYKKQEEALKAMPREEITITLPDGSEKKGMSWETTPLDIAKEISNSLAKQAVVAKVEYAKKLDTKGTNFFLIFIYKNL